MADLDHLYALPLEEFTPARDAAAKEIRKAGDRETAAVVAKLPKPTPAAWAANQVAREQPELIEAMLDAGAALREAQEAAVSGAGGRGLREATLAERAAVDAVMSAATAHRPAGRPLSRAMADRLRTTLHAAAGDESIREALAEGRLVSEAQAGGAWPFALEPAPPEDQGAAKKAGAATKGRGTKAGGDEATAATKRRGGVTKRGGAQADDDDEGAATKRGGAQADEDDEGAAKRGGAKTGGAAEAERAAAAEREAAERAEREARKALEAELREARGSMRVRERVFAGAEQDAKQAGAAAAEAKAALEQAQRAAEDAIAEAEAAARVLDEARSALNEARDGVARLEERLD